MIRPYLPGAALVWLCCALRALGGETPSLSHLPHAAVARVIVPERGGYSFGSGTLVDALGEVQRRFRGLPGVTVIIYDQICATEKRRKRKRGAIRDLIVVHPHDTVLTAFRLMDAQDVSQLPVFEEGVPIGVIREDAVMRLALQGHDLSQFVVREVMEPPLPILRPDTFVDELTEHIQRETAVLVLTEDGRYEVLTKYDLVHSLAQILNPQS